jgi:hypothetical protein
MTVIQQMPKDALECWCSKRGETVDSKARDGAKPLGAHKEFGTTKERPNCTLLVRQFQVPVKSI